MFWLFEDELPARVGGEAFGAAHMAYIVFFLLLAVGCALFCRKADEGRRRRLRRLLAALACFFGLCEYAVTALLGHLSRYALPLHVCSLMFFLAPLHAWTKRKKLRDFLGAVIFHPGLPGVLAALLFPDWLCYPFRNYVSISSFLSHGFVLAYGATLLVRIAEAADPAGLLRRDLKNSLLFMALGALVMLFFDRLCGTNYWFMAAPSVGSPFTGVFARGGYGAYLAAYALAALSVTALWYGLRYLFSVRGKKAPETFDRKR